MALAESVPQGQETREGKALNAAAMTKTKKGSELGTRTSTTALHIVISVSQV